MEPWVVATSLIFAYLLVTLGVAVVANRHMSVNLEDFLLCGRRTGFVVLYLTVVATFHSAFAFLGSGGFFYTHGIGFWAAGAWTVLVGGITYVVGTRIWALGKAFGYITPADMLADFYESEAVRIVIAVFSVLFTILYIQVQALALGYILEVSSDGRISFELGVFVMLAVAAVHLAIGGLRAVYWTDVMQGVWMYVAVWAGALVLSFELFGGPLELWRAVASERPELLTLPGPEGLFTPGIWIGMVITLSIGIVLQPHMMIRYYTAVDGKTLKLLGATTPIYLMTLYIPAALVGLGGALVLPDLAQADRIFPELLFSFAPPWLTGLILAGAAAAAMSTLDSHSARQHDRAHPRCLPALSGAQPEPETLRAHRTGHRAGASGRGVLAVASGERPPGQHHQPVRLGRPPAAARHPGGVLSGRPLAQQLRFWLILFTGLVAPTTCSLLFVLYYLYVFPLSPKGSRLNVSTFTQGIKVECFRFHPGKLPWITAVCG